MAERSSVGTQIRQYRKARQLTLQETARRCAISVSFLSQIERDQAKPSISTLHAIADALELSVAELFIERGDSEETAPVPSQQIQPTKVVRADQRRVIAYPGEGVRNEFLSPDPRTSIQMMMIVMPPHSSSGDVPFVHAGEECGVILQGQLETWVGEEKYILGPGDAIYHSSRLPHISRNAGPEDVVMVVAKTIPEPG